jgi:DNA-binding NtrC family response regulator
MKSIPPQPNPHLKVANLTDSIRILVVDDEPAILFAYRKLIENDGMVVDLSASLEDALTHIRTNKYLAVIADMRLAGSDNADGLEILRFVRKESPATMTILATGYGDSGIESIARSLGVSHYFKKPVQPSEILEALREFCNTPS